RPKRAQALALVVDRDALDDSQVVGRAAHVGDGPEAARSGAPDRGLAIQGVSEAQTWSEAVPATHQGVLPRPSGTRAGENQRSRKSARARIRQARAQVARLVLPH